MAIFASRSVTASHQYPDGSAATRPSASKNGPPRAPTCAAKCSVKANRAPPPGVGGDDQRSIQLQMLLKYDLLGATSLDGVDVGDRGAGTEVERRRRKIVITDAASYKPENGLLIGRPRLILS